MGDKAKILTTPPDSMATFYPPGYLEKNRAPEKYPARILEALAVAQNAMRSKKKVNRVADKFFLANALVENRPEDGFDNHGVNTGGFSDREIDRFIGSAMTLPASKDKDVLSAYKYGVVFNDKTGRYADAVRGKGATDSQRISLWNGVGKKRTFDPSVTGNPRGVVSADAENHAKKVMDLQRALTNKENKPFLDFFNNKVKGK